MKELEQKQIRLHQLMAEHEIDAILLQRASSFAWATGGISSYVNTASSTGAASLLITKQKKYVLTTNIEAERLENEEHLSSQGWEFHINPWFENPVALGKLTQGIKVGADTPLPGMVDLTNQLARVRSILTPEEINRFEILGKKCAVGMNRAIHSINPGMTEMEIAAILGLEIQKLGAQPIVNLIATDERVYSYRHPLPTEKKLEHYALLVVCGRWKGLVCSISRLVHFGKMPSHLHKIMIANAQIEIVFHQSTIPGVSLSQILQTAINAYKNAGYPEEWKKHHQGGVVGYESREYLGRPDLSDLVQVNQAYAWNPSIAGCKYEDTIIVTPTGNRVLTEIEDWPKVEITINGKTYSRPAILEIF